MKIKFDISYINFIEFEIILKKFYKKSFKHNEILFDIKNVVYIALPQLCYLFGWIEKLLRNGSSVDLDFGVRKKNDLYKVIKNYGFFTNHIFCQNRKFRIIYSEKSAKQSIGKTAFEESALINFQIFETENHYNAFIKRLKTESIDEMHSENPDDRVLLDRSGVRDIFLRELGANVFDHSEGSPAYIAVSKKNLQHLLLKTNPEIIRNYAKAVRSDKYIEVVVIDMGVGIPNRINEKFIKDKDAQKILKGKDETKKIEYAFWRDTSSKEKRDIEKEISNLKIEHFSSELVAPTGLFLVYQLALEYKGLLYCRSGKSIVSWDFSDGAEKQLDLKSWSGENIFNEDIEEIDGNIISAILPASIMHKVIGSEKNKKEIERIFTDKFCYINTHEIFSKYEKESAGISKALNNIRYTCREMKKNSALIVDFSNVELQTRALFWIVIFCMYWRYKNRYIILVDIERHQLRLLADHLKKEEFDYSETALYPLQCYSTIKKFSESIAVNYSHKPIRIKYVKELCLQDQIIKERKKILSNYINAFFRPGVRVYLPEPSKGFLEGYYELADVLSNSYISYLISGLILDFIGNSDISYIVLTTSILDKIGKNIASVIGLSLEKVTSPRNDASLAKISLQAKKENRTVLIISDVNVTLNTVNRFANHIGCKSIAATIIECSYSAQPFSNFLIKSTSIVKEEKLIFYSKKPKKWRIPTIQLVDSVTHKIKYERRGSSLSLWDNMKRDEYLMQWAKEKGVVRTGHFCYGTNCYIYFFDMQAIVEDHLKEITIDINESVNKILNIKNNEESEAYGHNKNPPIFDIKGSRKTSEITYSIYPFLNSAAEKVCKEIRTYLGGELIYLPRMINDYNGTSYTHNPCAKDLKKGGVHVFFDTAATTTKTIRNMLQLSGDATADILLIYILVNRISDDWPTFIEGIEKFMGCDVQIESFVKVGLPVHSRNLCPICKLRNNIDRVLLSLVPGNCRKLLSKYRDRFEPKDLSDIRKEKDSATNKIVLYHQIVFRDWIEKLTSMISFDEKEEFINFLDTSEKDHQIMAAIINSISLEIEFFKNNFRYHDLFDDQILEKIQSIAHNIIFKEGFEDDVICNAISASACINFNILINELARKKIFLVNDKIVECLIASIFIYKVDISLDKSVHVLERLNAYASDFNLSILVRSSIAEAAFYLRSLSVKIRQGNTPYAGAYRNIIGIYEQRDRSHTEMQVLINNLDRFVKKEDVKKQVEELYLGNHGLRQRIIETILPSIRTIVEAWPDKLSVELERTENLIYKYSEELDKTLMYCYNLLLRNMLDDDTWQIEKDSLYKALGALNRALFPDNENNLKSILEKEACVLDSVINDCLKIYRSDFDTKSIFIGKDGNAFNEVSIIPKIHLNDIISTIIDNMAKYSKKNTNGMIHARKISHQIIVDFESIPEGSLRIVEKPNHGLAKATSILSRYDATLQLQPIKNKEDHTKAKIRLTINT